MTEASQLSPKLCIDFPLGLQQPYLSFALFRQHLKTFLLDCLTAVTIDYSCVCINVLCKCMYVYVHLNL